MPGPVVVLAGGTGGAKLARGMLDIVGDDLAVVVNTADDIVIHGAYVSPDPDLVSFWLADRIDARGWGLEGDSFAAMEQLRELGVDVWFQLGDCDLAIGLLRAQRLAAGATLTQAIDELRRALGVRARVLPMTDARVATRVLVGERWASLQEFMIVGRGEGPVDGFELQGIDSAAATGEVLDAIASARAIVIGPSNPIVSIWPILRTRGVADALRATRAPVVAVSPIVGGAVLKGVMAPLMAWAGLACDARGVAGAYDGLIAGLLADEDVPGADVAVRRADTLMADAAGRRRVAQESLDFAESLA